MKIKYLIGIVGLAFAFFACDNGTSTTETAETTTTTEVKEGTGQSAVSDEVSDPNILQVAMSLDDFSTLVVAVKAAGVEDALVNVAVDLSGRAFCVYNAKYPTEKIGNFDVECIEEFIRAFTSNAKINLHVNVVYGTNSHHIAEAVFKAIGQALAKAIQITGSDIPSTKGTL